MGQTIHHQTTGDNGAVAAHARRVSHILSNGGSEQLLILAVKTSKGWDDVTSQAIVKAVRTAAVSLNLAKKGIDPDIIGAHSLRAGGAMALKLQKYPDTTIQKNGTLDLQHLAPIYPQPNRPHLQWGGGNYE